MKHIENTFKQTGVGELYYQGWLPEGDVRAIVVVFHGLAEHGGRYTNVVNQLVPQGFAVYALDLIGHGKSSGERLFVYRFEDLTEPLKSFLDMVKSWQPDKKVFMLAHSMGGLVGTFFLLDHQDELDGAVISGALTKVPDNITPVTMFMAKALSKLAPKVRLAGVDSSGISRDPQEVVAYVNDPLVFTGNTTARMGSEMIRAMERVKAEMGRIKLPVLLLHGGSDYLSDPDASQTLYEGVGSEDKTLKIYEGYYHEIYNDIGKEVPLADVQAWLEAHI